MSKRQGEGNLHPPCVPSLPNDYNYNIVLQTDEVSPSAAKLTFSQSPFTLVASAILLPSSQSGVIIGQCDLSNKEIAVHAVWFLESWE